MTPRQPTTTVRRDTDPELCPAMGKVKHRHYRAALRALRTQAGHIRFRGKDRGALHIFRCKACASWHIGNAQLDRPKEDRE